MTLPIVQLMFTIAAGYGLWRLLRSVNSLGRLAGLIVIGGFLARAFAAQLLFWISWFKLPIARSMQWAPGFWFFGIDAYYYYEYVNITLPHGLAAILTMPSDYPSRFFIQVLGFAIAAMGSIATVGVLLNLALYTATCLILGRIGMRDGKITTPALVAIAAISFSPAGILWALQPLKDTMFLFLVTAAIAACVCWYQLWIATDLDRDSRSVGLILSSVAIAALTYGIGGLRWYYAFALIGATAVMFTMIVAVVRGRRLPALATSVVVLFLMTQSLATAAEGSLPQFVAELLDVRTSVRIVRNLPGYAKNQIEIARVGFDNTPGDTTIQVGAKLRAQEKPPEPPVGVAETTPPPPPAPAPAPIAVASTLPTPAVVPPPQTSAAPERPQQPQVVETKPAPEPVATIAEAAPPPPPPAITETIAPQEPAAQTHETKPAAVQVADVKPEPQPAAHVEQKQPAKPAMTPAPQPSTKPAPVVTVAATPPPAATEAKPEHAPVITGDPQPRVEEPSTVQNTTTAAEETERAPATDSAATETAAPSEPIAAAAAKVETRKPAPAPAPVVKKPAPVVVATPVPEPPPVVLTETAAPAPAPVVAAVPAPAPPATVAPAGDVPTSVYGRIVAGSAAMFLPRSVAQRLGIVKIGGGRGMWMFAELDTIVFDVVLLFAVIYCVRALRRTRWRPTAAFVLVILTTALVAVPLLYTVNNFGTLFRQRQMIYIGLCLLPLTMLATSRREASPEEPRLEPAE